MKSVATCAVVALTANAGLSPFLHADVVQRWATSVAQRFKRPDITGQTLASIIGWAASLG